MWITLQVKNTMNLIFSLPALIAMGLIKIYQFLFSFDHSFWAGWTNYRVCIYHPSCSEYTYIAIERFGLIKGGWMGAKRIARCSPMYEGGEDPVPEK